MIPTPAYGHTLRADEATLSAMLDGVSSTPFWLDDPARPGRRPALTADTRTDLVVVGGGFCGLWTALRAKERDPGRRVIVLEAEQVAWAATGRNGGFCEASLTHGTENGELHFADELPVLERLAAENFRDYRATVARYDIDAEWEDTGVLTVATEPHQVAWLRAAAEASDHVTFLEGDELATRARSPLYLAGIFKTDGYSFVHPAKLAWGLAATAERLGVEIFEGTRVTGLSVTGEGVEVRTTGGVVRAEKAALATNVFPSPLKRLRLFTVPVYDYALMTEPLSGAQLESIGWTDRHGITDSSREFHYYRKSADDRILFGGYDAIYHWGRKVSPEHDQRRATFVRLADHFRSTFPQLGDVRFTHAWGGAIDMSTKLVAHHGIAGRGRVAYSAGYTGLGVGATRFGADTMLDLLEGLDTDRTALTMARKLPIPVPPEPFAYPLIQTMRRAVVKSDRNAGKDGPLLKLAGLFGVGFDS